jgi:hypothetical protein
VYTFAAVASGTGERLHDCRQRSTEVHLSVAAPALAADAANVPDHFGRAIGWRVLNKPPGWNQVMELLSDDQKTWATPVARDFSVQPNPGHRGAHREISSP